MKSKAIQIIGILSLLAIAVVIDSFWRLPDNPATISLLIFFWIGVFALVAPRFFRKYKILVVGIYILVIIYFLIVRIGYSDTYFEEYKESVLNFLVLPIPIIAVFYIFEHFRQIKQLKAEKKAAELSLLKQQIDPHFFFNTLNNLYGLTVENNPKAPEVILQLSDLMRYTIYKGKEEHVLLSEEINYLENYLKIYQLRFHKSVAIDFQKELDQDYPIAPLLLIVPLENAIKHGVEKLTNHAFININISAANGQLQYVIENNYDPDNETKKGVGLDNLKKRLTLLYSQKHLLEYTSENGVFKLKLEIQGL
ncbi:MAG: histidine kinase [Chitinophagales bacterium]|nr:histidine kinase [Chitinophagales bacterium]